MKSYYWNKGYTPELKEKLHKAIDESNTNEIYDLLETLQPIFIGYDEYGWKFTFAPHDFTYFRPNVNSFLSWIKSADFITDENNIKMTPENFLKAIAPKVYGKNLLDTFAWAKKYEEEHNMPYEPVGNELYKEFSLQYGVSANQYDEFYLGEYLFNINVIDMPV